MDKQEIINKIKSGEVVELNYIIGNVDGPSIKVVRVNFIDVVGDDHWLLGNSPYNKDITIRYPSSQLLSLDDKSVFNNRVICDDDNLNEGVEYIKKGMREILRIRLKSLEESIVKCKKLIDSDINVEYDKEE